MNEPLTQTALMVLASLLPFLVISILLLRRQKSWFTIALSAGISALILSLLTLAILPHVIASGPHWDGLKFALAAIGLGGLGVLAALAGLLGTGMNLVLRSRRMKELKRLPGVHDPVEEDKG